ncbi:hypothetical protein Ancab_012121 [Ancistrocladus abbreviatus]
MRSRRRRLHANGKLVLFCSCIDCFLFLAEFSRLMRPLMVQPCWSMLSWRIRCYEVGQVDTLIQNSIAASRECMEIGKIPYFVSEGAGSTLLGVWFGVLVMAKELDFGPILGSMSLGPFVIMSWCLFCLSMRWRWLQTLWVLMASGIGPISSHGSPMMLCTILQPSLLPWIHMRRMTSSGPLN